MYSISSQSWKTILCLFILLVNLATANDTKLRIVTSFSILQDLVQELGGEYVVVTNLVNRNNDAHTYQPKPSDVVAIAQTDIVIYNGLGFEGWIERLIHNSDNKTIRVVASQGVNPIKNGQEVDPHAWQSFKNIRVYIHNITGCLIRQRPKYAMEFKEKQNDFLSRLKILEEKLMVLLEEIPLDQRIVVTSHDAFGYLSKEFKIQFLAPVGYSIENEATALDVAAIIDQIRKQNVKALFVENINNARLMERIASETQIEIGGRLYSDALSEIHGPADTYLKMMQHNVESLIHTFHSHSPVSSKDYL